MTLFWLFISPSILLASPTEIRWSTLQLLTEKKEDKIPEDLQKIIGPKVTLNGFMLPLEFSSREISEFLFMPYVPSCVHVPPPPPSQIIHVVMKENVKAKSSFFPNKVIGVLSLEENKDFESSYKMVAEKVEEITESFTPEFVPDVGHTY